MADTLKINASPAITVPLALGNNGYPVLMRALDKYPVAEKVSKFGDQVYKLGAPVVQQLDGKKELALALLGIALVFHGVQFKNILLCAQAVGLLLFSRMRISVGTLWHDAAVAREKLQADAPVEGPMAQQAEATAASTEKVQREVDAAKKFLKVLDAERLSAAGVDVLLVAALCILVVQGSLVQKLTVAGALVGLLVDRFGCVLVFPGYEDMQSWTQLLVRLSAWAAVLPVVLVLPSFALIMDAAVLGAHFACKHGLKFAEARGIIEDAEAIGSSKRGLAVYGTLSALGALWQLWAWAADSGMAWYFQVLYLPACLAEGLLGLL